VVTWTSRDIKPKYLNVGDETKSSRVGANDQPPSRFWEAAIGLGAGRSGAPAPTGAQ